MNIISLLGMIILIFSLDLSAQRDTLGRYSPGFKFKDGLYLSFRDFKQNCPSIQLGDLRSDEGKIYEEIDPLSDWYHSISDSIVRIEKDSVWGFSNRGKVFLRNQEFFDRMIVIGSISHIVHREEYLDYNTGMYNGFGYTPMRREVQVEFFIDMISGEKEEFTESNFERLLENDPALLHSFENMNKKKKKESMFFFIHSYNQEHPIYFPISRCKK